MEEAAKRDRRTTLTGVEPSASGLGVLAAFGVGCLAGHWLKGQSKSRKAGAISVPESGGGGAVSAVTGGHPEDMNEMPPALEIGAETPVYDGSDV